MSFLGKLFGKKEKESLDEGMQKTREGFLSTRSAKPLPAKVRWMKMCLITWKTLW